MLKFWAILMNIFTNLNKEGKEHFKVTLSYGMTDMHNNRTLGQTDGRTYRRMDGRTDIRKNRQRPELRMDRQIETLLDKQSEI